MCSAHQPLNGADSPDGLFWAKVDTSGDCWVWTGYTNPHGYGVGRRYKGGTWLAHRRAWFLAYGPIPVGLCVLHHCDNRPCVRPEHLWLGTPADNTADMIAKGRMRRDIRRHTKLSPEIVREVRRRYTGRHGEITQMAREFGVKRLAMSYAVHGKTWTEVA